jgi:MFS family permease
MLDLLRGGRFLAFSISQSVSNFGDKLDYMALLAMIAALSSRHQWQSARANSFLLVIATLPVIIFGPLAGVLVDRWNRRRIMIVCDSLRAALVLSIPFVAIRTQNLPLVFLIAFVVFLLGMFFNTARLAVIPDLVGPGNLLEANSLLSLLGRGMTFLGLLLGGLIVDWPVWKRIGITETWSAGFFLDSLTFVASVTTLLFLTIPFHPRAGPPPRTFDEARSRLRTITDAVGSKFTAAFQDLTEAFRLMRTSPPIRMVIFSVLLFVLLGSGVIILLVPIIQTAPNDTGLNMGTRGVGFTGAVGSIGLVLSSLLYALVGRRLPLRGVLLGGFLLLGLLGLVIAVSRSMLLILLLAFAAGLLLAPIYITQDTILHQNVPAQVRGRVFSAREWLLNLAATLSAAIIGQLLLVFPPHFVVTYRLPLVGSELLLDARRILLLVISALVAGLSGYQLLATRRRPPATDAQLPAQEK